jgi:hypothetical protein
MGDYSDYEMNEMTARENALDDRAAIIRQRYKESSQPPYSVIIEHGIDRIFIDIDIQEYVWCECGSRFPLKLFKFHVRDAVLDEMIGIIPDGL